MIANQPNPPTDKKHDKAGGRPVIEIVRDNLPLALAQLARVYDPEAIAREVERTRNDQARNHHGDR